MSIKNYSDRQLFDLLVDELFKNMPKGQVDMRTLAAKVGISTCQFNRRIKFSTGKTAREYIMSLRLEESKRLLEKYTDMSMTEVSQRCGFADSSHFCHVFRRYFNMSPTQYVNSLGHKRHHLEAFVKQKMNLAGKNSDLSQSSNEDNYK